MDSLYEGQGSARSLGRADDAINTVAAERVTCMAWILMTFEDDCRFLCRIFNAVTALCMQMCHVSLRSACSRRDGEVLGF